MFCGQCGHKLEPNSRFCGECGLPVMSVEDGPTSVHEVNKETVPQEERESSNNVLMNQKFALNTDQTFCGQCGHKLELNSQFCGACGTSVVPTEDVSKRTNILETNVPHSNGGEHSNKTAHHESESVTSNVMNANKAEPSPRNRVPKKKKSRSINKKWIVGLVIIILLGGIGYGGFSYVKYLHSKPAVVNSFQSSIESADLEKLQQLIVVNEEIDDEMLQIFMQQMLDYYRDHEDMLATDLEQLKAGITAQLPYALTYEEGKFFEKYGLTLQSKELTIVSSLKDVEATLYLGDRVVIEDLELNQRILNLLPGVYTVQINSLNELTPFTITEEVDLFKAESTTSVTIQDDLNKNAINSSEVDAIIYINGESTEKTASELRNVTGLPDGTEVYAVLTVGDQEIQSNTVTVRGNQFINLEFDYVKVPTKAEAQTQVELIISKYLKGFAESVNQNDFSIIRPYLLSNSELYNQQKKYIASLNERYIEEEYLNHKVLSFDYDEAAMKGTIKVEESYEIIRLESESTISTYESIYEFIYSEEEGAFFLTELLDLS